jgi:iron complex outermembrane receptor protein
VKLQSPDGSFVADANIFYMDRDNAQLSQSSQVDPVDPNTFFFITNNGEAQEYGLESSFAWQAGDAFRFHGAFGWLESEIGAWAVRPGVVGRDLAHAPNYTLSLGVTWEGGSGWNVKVDVIAVDGFYFDISHDQKSESYQLLNLSVGKSWDSWSASVWGKNIFDETYATRGFFFGNEPPNFSPKLYMKSGDPQQVGLTVAYAF